MVNGTKTDGIAKKARNCVLAKYDALSPTNTITKPAESALYAQDGYAAEAKDIATTLGITLEPLPFPETTNLKSVPKPLPNIMVYIGDSIAPTIKNLACAVSVVPA